MNFKIIIALAMLFCALMVLPVNAFSYTTIPSYSDLGINPTFTNLVITGEYVEFDLYVYKNDTSIIHTGDASQTPFYSRSQDGLTITFNLQNILNIFGDGNYYFSYYDIDQDYESDIWYFTYDSNYVPPEYDINVDESQNLINLGIINSSVISLTYGSLSSTITAVNYRDNTNCIIYNMNNGLITIDLNEQSNTANFIFYGSTELSNFETEVTINYNFDVPITPTPTPTPEITDNKNFQIRNIDYSSSDNMLISGLNLTVWYLDSNDIFSNSPMFQSNNAPSIINLQVPKNTGSLFVEYGYMPNYKPVKVQSYPYLNNRVGYWINYDLSDFTDLYYEYYDENNPITTLSYGITVIDSQSHLPVSNVAITIDNANTQYTSNYGGTTFRNITQGTHTFRLYKNGYNSLQFTKDIYITSSTEIEFFQISVIPTATVTPTPIRPEQTLTPIDKPTNIMESVSYGLAKVFGVKTVDNANYIFALLIILFPAAIAGGITHQALGFIAGGMLGFVFALTIGLIPIWTFFAMCLLAVIYIMLIRGNEGF